MATSLICESYQNILPYWCPISLPGSLMDKHQKVTVTPTRFFLLQPTLCFTPDSNTIVQGHSVFTHTLHHTMLINCITTSLGGSSTDQLRNVYTLCWFVELTPPNFTARQHIFPIDADGQVYEPHHKTYGLFKTRNLFLLWFTIHIANLPTEIKLQDLCQQDIILWLVLVP